MKARPSSDALADLVRLRDHLREEAPGAAERAGRALEIAMGSLAVLPARGRRVGDTEFRELIVPFGDSAFVVRYCVDERRDEVVVIRDRHGREQRK